VLLLGGGELLVRLCDAARQASYEVAVITSPRHAAEAVDGARLDARLEALRIPHLTVDRIDTPEVRSFVGARADAIALSVGAAWLFSPAALDELFGGRLFNVHGTRLPENRGGGGFSWQILTGNRFGFCIVHRVDAGVDTGDVILCEEFLYPAGCRTPADYQAHYTAQVVAHLSAVLADLRRAPRSFQLTSQPEYLSTYWPRLHTPTHAWINWDWSAAEIERFICAFDDPYPGAQTTWNGGQISLKKASLNLQDLQAHPFQAGLVYRVHPKWICVAARGAALVVEAVGDAHGASVLDRIRIGDRLFTAPAALETAAQRVSYTPGGLKS